MTVRASQAPNPNARDLRQRLDRLGGLPLRPATARAFLLAATPDSRSDRPPCGSREAELDPGWALIALRPDGFRQPLHAIAEADWWRPLPIRERAAVDQLWKHSVAVAIAARWLAKGRDDPEHLARVGLLGNLGLWSLAAVEPGWLADLFATEEPADRRDFLPRHRGLDLVGLGLRNAERWGGPPELVDAAWLHAGPLARSGGCARDPSRFRLIEQAYLWAEQTPWRLGLGPGSPVEVEPCELKRLIAAVQVHCGPGLVDPADDADSEHLLRSHARLLIRAGCWNRERAAYARVIDELTADAPATMRAPTSKVPIPDSNGIWEGEAPAEPDNSPEVPVGSAGASPSQSHMAQRAEAADRGASPSGRRRRRRLRRAWQSLRNDRDNQQEHLAALLRAGRRAERLREQNQQQELLHSLGEFAAGAGHELNNPLAVILGRAQLLLARTSEPEAQRSLRAIISQTRRAHRILRDLIYVARPTAPRPRLCQPAEVGRLSLRDLADEAESRGVHLGFEAEGAAGLAWTDPEALRHLVEILARNAIEASPPGETVQVSASRDRDQLVWRFRDAGRGLGPEEAKHLLDPFYCGRAAGRGLGLGLSRAARFLEMIGGSLRWQTNADGGSTFLVTLPLLPMPGDAGIPEPVAGRFPSSREGEAPAEPLGPCDEWGSSAGASHSQTRINGRE